MLIVIYVGTIILSFANSYEQILFARILQGVGCGACLMGPLVYLAKNMERKNFSKFSGIVMGFGGLGALFAFNPFYLITILLAGEIAFFYFLF